MWNTCVDLSIGLCVCVCVCVSDEEREGGMKGQQAEVFVAK